MELVLLSWHLSANFRERELVPLSWTSELRIQVLTKYFLFSAAALIGNRNNPCPQPQALQTIPPHWSLVTSQQSRLIAKAKVTPVITTGHSLGPDISGILM